jgi:hypothetical protein
MRQNRGPWYLVTGLIFGLVCGMVYSLWVEPVQYIDAAPLSLKDDAKDEYRAMIALAYQAGGNLGRARQRLALLNDSSPAQALAAQAGRDGQASRSGRALSILAEAYNPQSTPQLTLTATQGSTPAGGTVMSTPRPANPAASATATLEPGQVVRTATGVPSPTPTQTPTTLFTLAPRPTVRPLPTLGAPFTVKSREKVCDAKLPGLLQVEAFTNTGQPASGVTIVVTWPPEKRDQFTTGLMLDFGAGYADFQMTEGIVYAVRAGENGEEAKNLSIEQCRRPDGSGFFNGGWKVTFIQP